MGTASWAALNWQMILRKVGYCRDSPSIEKCLEKSHGWVSFARFGGLPASVRAAVAMSGLRSALYGALVTQKEQRYVLAVTC